LQEAAKQIGVAAEGCIYVGDDLRDVQAGSAANMRTAAAAWGYLGLGPDIDQWGADHVIEFPAQLLEVLALP
jgi:phosphoglycolate phosphatase